MASRNTVPTSSRMGEMPEGQLLFRMAVPLMLSMLVQALYNVVDSIYVSAVSEDCLTALSLAFPIQNIQIGLATGTGVGITTLVSRALGRKDSVNANRIAGNSIFLCVCCWLIMAVFGMFFARSFIWSQTDSASIRGYGDIYLQIVTIGSLFLYFEMDFERLLQSTGLTKFFMWSQMIGAVTNIILDPFFIFGWCGLPAMATQGAAIATVIGQACGACAGLLFLKTKNKELHIHPADVLPKPAIIRDTYKIGFPSILMVGVSSITNYLMNHLLIGFTSTAVAVYGAYMKLQSFFFMPVFGLNNAMIPVIGYNYGARKKERIYRTVRYGVLFACVITSIGCLLFELIPATLLGIFSPSETLLAIGSPALRIIAIHFPVAGFCIVTGSACQALDRSIYTFITSLMRQIVALIPAAYLLALTGNINNIWWCFPIAEIISMIFSLLFVRKAFAGMEERLSQQ